jgi:hypothetical protein
LKKLAAAHADELSQLAEAVRLASSSRAADPDQGRAP